MTRQQRRPFPINQQLGATLDTGEINDEAAARQKAINEAAAASYENWRQNQIAQSAATSDQNQQALASAKSQQALGSQFGFNQQPQKDRWNPDTQQYERPGAIVIKDQYDPATGKYIRSAQPGYRTSQPTGQQLQQNFAELPTPQQTAIAQSPQGSQFVPPDQAMKLVQGGQEDSEKSIKSQINILAESMTKGDIGFDPTTRTFHQFQLDPVNPASGLKVKVPLNPMQIAIMQEGMKRKMLPDIDSFSQSPAQRNTPNDLVNVSQDLGQGGVTAPNGNASIAALAANLANTKTDVPYDPSNAAGNSSSTMALSPYQYQGTMQLGTNYGYQGNMGIPNDPNLQTPAMTRASVASSLPVASAPLSSDAATAAGQRTRQFFSNNTSSDSPAIAQMSDNFNNDLYNTGTLAMNVPNLVANTGIRFINGLTGSKFDQIGMAPYAPDVNLSQAPAPSQDVQDAQMRLSMSAQKAAFMATLRAKQLATSPTVQDEPGSF